MEDVHDRKRPVIHIERNRFSRKVPGADFFQGTKLRRRRAKRLGYVSWYRKCQERDGHVFCGPLSSTDEESSWYSAGWSLRKHVLIEASGPLDRER